VHLINFQVVKEYNLRHFHFPNSDPNKVVDNCSLYELDFAVATLQINVGDPQVNQIKSIVFANNAINYSYLCNNLGILYNISDFRDSL